MHNIQANISKPRKRIKIKKVSGCIFANPETIFVNSEKGKVGWLLLCAAYPRRDGFPGLLFECGAERAVTVESAFGGELGGRKGAVAGNGLLIQTDEVFYAQSVDVGIIGETLLGKVLTQIGTVGADGLGELGKGEVVLQEEKRIFAVLFQLRAYYVGNGA